MLRCFLEILSVGWKDIPGRHFLPQHSDRSHVGEFTPQTLVVLLGGGKSHAVVGPLVTFIAENQHNLVLNIDREAAEHGTCHWRQWSDRVENEFMRDRPALLDTKAGVVQREEGRIATGLRYTSDDRAPFTSASNQYCVYIRNVASVPQAIRRAILLGCSPRILSMCVCNSAAMFFFASSKLLPRTTTDGFLQRPFQPSSSDQKSQATGMLAITCRFTT